MGCEGTKSWRGKRGEMNEPKKISPTMEEIIRLIDLHPSLKEDHEREENFDRVMKLSYIEAVTGSEETYEELIETALLHIKEEYKGDSPEYIKGMRDGIRYSVTMIKQTGGDTFSLLLLAVGMNRYRDGLLKGEEEKMNEIW